MVIECMGLPGSGKTYLMELVEKELRRREVDYVNVSAGLMNRISWKILRKIARALIYLSPDARWLRDRLLKILGEEGELHSSFGIYENEKYTVKSAALFAFIYRRMIRSHKLYLFDEGLVHALVKFCADFKISDETFGKMVTEFSVSSFNRAFFEKCGLDLHDLAIVFVTVVIVFAVSVWQETRGSVRDLIGRRHVAIRWTIWYALILFVLVFGAYGFGYAPVDPLYAQF